MNIRDSVFGGFARGEFKENTVVATLPAEPGVRGIRKPWVVNTERPRSVEERLAAIEERLAKLEQQEP